MIRFLNTLQGLISLGLVVFSAILGWPIYIVIVGLIAPIAISLIITIGLKETSPKGRIREAIEALIELFGLGVLTFWAINSEVSLHGSTPWWMALVALLPVLFNLGIIVAWICWLASAFLGYAQELFEFISGETVRAK
jgi:hypothetical protein